MAKIAIRQFRGATKRPDPRLLDPAFGQVLRNGRTLKGVLTPLDGLTQVAVPSKAGTILSLYRFGQDVVSDTNFWFNWTTDVDCVRGPIAGDTSEKTYFTGDGVPKITDNSIALGADYPNASYTLGLPAPAASTSLVVNGSGTGVAETRVYVVCYVSAWGEIGPPSLATGSVDVQTGQTVTLNNLPTAPAGNYNVATKQIFRAVTGNDSVEYLFVKEVAVAVTSTTDDVAASALGEALPSLGWVAPPTGMKGLVSLPNGILAGFVGRDLYLCEPYHPYAWPLKYVLTADYPIVGLGVVDTTLVVLTTGTPYYVQGTDPSNMAMVSTSIQQACASKRSIVSALGGVIYASPDGLMLLSPGSEPRNLTDAVFTSEQWQALVPSSIHGYLYQNYYVGFYDTGSVQGGFMLSMGGDWTDLDTYATAGFNDLQRDALFLVSGGKIQKFNAGSAAPLDLRFDLGQFDSRITFARNAAAVYFGSDGLLKTASPNVPRIDYDPITRACRGFLVEEARTNLVLYSGVADNAYWATNNAYIVPNAVVSPTGILHADKLVENTTGSVEHFLDRAAVALGAAANTVNLTWSRYVKAGERSLVQLSNFGNPSTSTSISTTFDLAGGTVIGRANVGSSTRLGDGIENVGNGWYRCWHAFNFNIADTNIYARLLLLNGSGQGIYTGDGVSGVYTWGAQLEVGAFPTSAIATVPVFTSRASTATYFDSTGLLKTAAINEARNGYGLVGSAWTAKGLELEAAATNLLTYSEQFDNAAWANTNRTVTANAVAAPDGAVTAEKHAVNNGATSSWGAQYVAQGAGTFTYSVYLKDAGGGQANLYFFSTEHSDNWVRFNLSAGTYVASYGPVVKTYSITPVNDGWFRYAITFTTTGMTNFQVGIRHSDWTGDGVKGYYIWGAQLEAGPIATSYIPTTTAAVTRSADVSSSTTVTRPLDDATIGGNAFSGLYSSSGGTLFMESMLPAFYYSTVTDILGLRLSQDSDDYLSLRSYGSNIIVHDAMCMTNNVPQFDSAGIGGTVGTWYRQAVAFAANDGRDCFNGGTVWSDGTVVLPAPVELRLGGGGARYLKRVTYYPRAVSNAHLQTLTSGIPFGAIGSWDGAKWVLQYASDPGNYAIAAKYRQPTMPTTPATGELWHNTLTDSLILAPTMKWRSKQFYLAGQGLAFAKVDAVQYPTTFRMYVDGVLKHTRTVSSKASFRLPDQCNGDDFEFEVEGTTEIRSILAASSAAELRDA